MKMFTQNTSSITCTIVFFNPTGDDLLFWENFINANSEVNFILVKNSEFVMEIQLNNNVIEIIDMGYNIGLSRAYNEALALCDDLFFATFDQDSRPKYDYLQIASKQLGDADSLVAGIGFQQKHFHDISFVKWLISSGCVFKANLLKNQGGFDEYYFIDRVDIDICFSLRRAGYTLMTSAKLEMEHSIGDQRTTFFKLAYRYHSSKRIFYMVRNRFYFYRKFYGLFGIIIAVFLTCIQLLKIILFHEDRWAKVSTLFSAIITKNAP